MFNRTLHQFSKSRKQDRVLPRSLGPDRAGTRSGVEVIVVPVFAEPKA